MSDICFLGMKVTPTGHIRLISYCRVWNLDALSLFLYTSAFTIWPIRRSWWRMRDSNPQFLRVRLRYWQQLEKSMK